MMSKSSITLRGISRTCDKIESVLIRKPIDLESHFSKIDPKHHGLISDAKFFTVVYCQLGREFGVCQEEVHELADYFKKEDGRVAYLDFLREVSPTNPDAKPFVTGLEWEDHQQINVLSPFEFHKLNSVLTKIAYSCRSRGVVLEPLFKDYERNSHNNGTVTIQHFRRILYFAGITLGSKEFQLLFKRFMKHGYTINYVAFLQDIQDANKWFDQHGIIDCDEDFPKNYPGRVIVAEVETLPRPEFDASKLGGTSKACHPGMGLKERSNAKLEELMGRIKKYIVDNRVSTRQFFEKFDNFRRGFITKSQFHHGIDAIGLSRLHGLYIAQHDLEKIFDAYQDEYDPDRVGWSKFCDDIDQMSIRCSDKQPYCVSAPSLENVQQPSRPGSVDWETVSKSTKQLAQETLFRLRNIIKSRRIFIETFFKGYDKGNKFHVSQCQMRRVFSANSIILSEKEIEALMNRYGDDMGFNYWKFLQEIDEIKFCDAKHEKIMKMLSTINESKSKPSSNSSIIELLAKVKGQITRRRINIDQFLRNGEKLNQEILPSNNFRSGFSAAGIILDDRELDGLCDAFKLHSKPGFVDHKSFLKIMNQAFFQSKLEKLPCTVPIQHLPSPDDYLNFLDYEERHIVSYALQKLSRYHDGSSNMKYFFEDRAGYSDMIDKEDLKKVLTMCGGLMDLITKKELDVLFKCFSVSVVTGRKFDYKNFSMILSCLNDA